MDGGSGLNILYAETLKGMGIPMSRLSESNMTMMKHVIINGTVVSCMAIYLGMAMKMSHPS